MTTFIEDSPRPFQSGWMAEAHRAGTALGAVVIPRASAPSYATQTLHPPDSSPVLSEGPQRMAMFVIAGQPHELQDKPPDVASIARAEYEQGESQRQRGITAEPKPLTRNAWPCPRSSVKHDLFSSVATSFQAP